jgi:hypothetical protein
MATNFPGSLDTFTNPTSSSTLDSPSHAAQHTNINDAMEAVQAKLGVGAGTIGTWTTFAPNFRPFSGTWTTVSASSAHYARLNDIVFGVARLYIGNPGTGSNGVLFDLPVAGDTGYVGIGNGREIRLTGWQFHAYLVSSTIGALRFYNNGDTATGAWEFHFNFMYKAA